MQGVFIRYIILDINQLDDLVDRYSGVIYLVLPSSSGMSLIPLHTQREVEKMRISRRTQAVFSQILPLEWPHEKPTLILEKLKAGAYAGTEKEEVRLDMCFVRPRTKKELKEQCAQQPSAIFLQATSIFGNEYNGFLTNAPKKKYAVVGPEPETKRSWFATISWSERKKSWTVE